MSLLKRNYKLSLRLLLIVSIPLLLFTSCRTKATILAWDHAKNKNEFPEASLNLPSTGVCFSGGGTRAMNCAIGQMKGLWELGLWEDIGYVSAVSGGSWASTIFTYYNAGAANDKELLGTIIPPNELTLAKLNEMEDGFMGQAMTRNLEKDLFERLGLDLISFGALQKMDFIWIDGIGHTYLKQFGLYDPEHPKYFTLDETTRYDILQRNKKLKKEDFIMVHNQEGDIKRPFLVVNSSLLAPSKDLPLRNPENLSVFNYTPLYIGSNNPVRITDRNLVSGKSVTFNAGGGFIEPFGFGGKLLKSQRHKILGNTPTPLRVKLDKKRFEVVDATGTSSAAFGAIVSSNTLAQLPSKILPDFSLNNLIPEENYWPIKENGSIGKEEKYRFTDGGNLENYGLITLLQREVKKIVVFINTNSPLLIDCVIDGNNPPTGNEIDSDLFPLFGYPLGNQRNNKVFSKDAYLEVYKGLSEAKRNNKTVMTKTNLETVRNDRWGIHKGHKVEILWVYNERVLEWENQLPQPVQEQIKLGARGEFPDFPLYKLIFENGFSNGMSFTPQQVNLLYQLSAWNVYTNKEVFDFLRN